MKNKQTKLLMSMAICALLNGNNFSQAVQVQSAQAVEAQQLEDDSFLQIDAAFDDAFEISKEDKEEKQAPSNSTLLQLGGSLGHRILIDNSDSDSDSGSESSDSEPDDSNNLQEEQEDDEDENKTDQQLKDENQMKDTSNAKDTGKISGFSMNDDKINRIFDDYTGADNDDFMKSLVEDYGTQDKKTPANPGGIVLTKYHGERATRRFVQVALKVPETKIDFWIKKNFKAAWAKYDVLCSGSIDENMIPIYFRSLLGDNTAQFALNDEERFKMALNNE